MGGSNAGFFILIFFLLANISSAYNIKSYEIDYNIIEKKVVVQAVIELDQISAGNFSLSIPSDSETIGVYLDGIKTDFIFEDDLLKLNLNSNRQIKFSYITTELIDESNFLLNLPIEYNTESVKLNLVLPEGAVLRKPINNAGGGSIYPKPDKATTDGRSLIFVWEISGLKKGEDISIFAQIQPETSIAIWIVLIFLAAILSLVLLIFFKRAKTEIKERVIVKKEDLVEKHLKPEEEQIINVLKLKESSCEQGTLRIATGFSKANLSRILKELEERKVVYKEKRGKKNLIFIKKVLWNILEQ